MSFWSGTEELPGAHPGILYDPDWSVTDQFLAVAAHHHMVDTAPNLSIRSLLTLNCSIPQNDVLVNVLITVSQYLKVTVEDMTESVPILWTDCNWPVTFTAFTAPRISLYFSSCTFYNYCQSLIRCVNHVVCLSVLLICCHCFLMLL